MSTSESEREGTPSEEELRAAYEAQVKQLRIEHVLIEDIVTLINLGMRRTGLIDGTQDERDPNQVRLAIEAVRALLPLLEQAGPSQVGQVRDALSQLQLAYVKIGGAPAGPADDGEASPQPGATPAGEPGAPTSEQPPPGEPGPAQRSGRLWVPGQ